MPTLPSPDTRSGRTGDTTSRAIYKPYKRTKTGCKTCRIRRVKCDEERPSCLKCTSTGRSCDGYTQHQGDSERQISSYAQVKSTWPSRALAALPGFGNDMYYLEFYYYCVGPKLSGTFDTEFWSRTILQMAHAEPGVRTALIALGHLNRYQSGTLQHARQTAITMESEDRRFWVNYNKAIRHLITHMTVPSFSAEVGLVLCLLFACIEFLQANVDVAFTHIRSGLNIVRELRYRKTFSLGSSSATASGISTSTRKDPIEQTIVPILTQALASALPYSTSLGRDFDFLESCPRYYTEDTFNSLTDARASFFDLRNAAILIARDMAVKMCASVPFTSSDHQRQVDLLYCHRAWLQALVALENSREWSSNDMYALSALKVGYYSSYTACSCITDRTQMAFDAHLESFQLLLANAAFLISSLELRNCHTDPASMNVAANFTFDTSLIPALFHTAVRCRCPITRRRAVDLLASHLPREGLWNPKQHQKVAKRVIEIEETDVDTQGWPVEAARLCRSSVGTEVDNNSGFQAEFLFAKDLATAGGKSWAERLTLAAKPLHNLYYDFAQDTKDTEAYTLSMEIAGTSDTTKTVISEGILAPHHRSQQDVMLSSTQSRTSQYTTGLLTTSGWTPLRSGSGKVLRTSAIRSSGMTDDTDVEELFRCYEADRSSYLAVTEHITDDSQADHDCATDATLPDKYLSYSSYFRHAGWIGYASLEQGKQPSATAPATLTSTGHDKAHDLPSASIGMIHQNNVTEVTTPDLQHSQAAMGDYPHDKAIVGDEVRTVADEFAPSKQAKQVRAFFHPEEDAWLILFHTKVKSAAEAGQDFKLPGHAAILTSFNTFFEGRIMRDEHGQELPPRQAREEKSMKSKVTKMHTKIWCLRDEARRLLGVRRSEVMYVPEITEGELRQYLADGTRPV
ncbi:hypothetical protein OPT61_g60 [Boeremia exigua]|uniref:Uncharacterized protein n=1 Tax=Boeremia exigua TaxID=749465 RepID=A0ACC2IVI6_9PLEO|nr:hypothetical protein OPT61_g60 [Boeremia exigua]